MNFAAILKFLPTILSFLTALGGIGFAVPNGLEIFNQGSGTPGNWLSLFGGGGAGLVGLLLGSKWMANVKPPNAQAALAAAIVLWKYFPPDSVQAKQIDAIARELGAAMLPTIIPPKPAAADEVAQLRAEIAAMRSADVTVIPPVEVI